MGMREYVSVCGGSVFICTCKVAFIAYNINISKFGIKFLQYNNLHQNLFSNMPRFSYLFSGGIMRAFTNDLLCWLQILTAVRLLHLTTIPLFWVLQQCLLVICNTISKTISDYFKFCRIGVNSYNSYFTCKVFVQSLTFQSW